MKGKLNEISIAGLAKLLYETGQSGRLLLAGVDGSAQIFFAAGKVAGFEIEGSVSADGLYDIFRWRAGEFEFTIGDFAVASRVPVDTAAFVARGAKYERRWYALARELLTPDVFIKPTTVLVGSEPDRDGAALRKALGEGKTLGELAAALGMGLLATAEGVSALVKTARVAVGEVVSPQLAAAAAEFLRTLLRDYETFAGRVLAKKLTKRLAAYAARTGLAVTFNAAGLAVDSAAGLTSYAEKWQGFFRLLVSEMEGPVGREVATLLWQRAWAALPAAYAAALRRFHIDDGVAGVGKDDASD